MNKLIISAPFGNYLNEKGVTSTLGTFTLHKRAGILKRLWRIFTTVRYYRRPGAWLNKLGLPNPGIQSVVTNVSDKIISIHGFNYAEWIQLIALADHLMPLAIEMNFSCPNVTKTAINEAKEAALYAINKNIHQPTLIAKLPPVRWLDFGNVLFDVGIRHFHLCNTIPTPGGGLSGKPLKQYSLWAIEEFRQRWGNEVVLIGGGGVTNVEDVKDYVLAGADHVAVASMLFNPFNRRKLTKFRDYLYNEGCRCSIGD